MTESESQSEAAIDRANAVQQEQMKLRYAFWVALAALMTLILILIAGVARWSAASDVASVISPIAGVVGTIAGAYLGHQAGSAGRERDAADRREQARIGQQLAAVADRGAAARILGIDSGTEQTKHRP